MKQDIKTKPVTLNLNVVILGAIAKVYAAASTSAPQRQWGSEISLRSILWKGDLYSVAPYRNKEAGLVGLRLTITLDAMNGGREQKNYIFPYEAFESVKVDLVECEDATSD